MSPCQNCGATQPWTAEREFKLQETLVELRLLHEELKFLLRKFSVPRKV
ncbi:hypothetical protein LCGC14_0941890 [marine sediment metagenome]|uniref:Uncharacterized protein n=1 Tax=marine sediment metagenome TaxID=412755 RepID=A0A0F9NJW0_9ZZZZ